jgi:hypothetical protein
MLELFGWKLNWAGIIFGCMLLLVVVLVIRKFVMKHRRKKRHFNVRDAATKHAETILFCVRAVGSNATSVSTCIQRAIDRAASPLRVSFAVVQEDVTQDVHTRVAARLRDGGDGHDHASRIRTHNVLDSNGFMEALLGWQRLRQKEAFVVIVDSGNLMLRDWDLGVVEALRSEPATTVVTAPGPGKFPCLLYGTPQCRFAPAVRGVAFVVRPQATPVICASHNFLAMHGKTFAQLRRPRQFVPRYVLDVVLSDYLFQHGLQFVAPPATLYSRRAASNDAELEDQRPPKWHRRYQLSQSYCAFAGLRPEHPDQKDTDRDTDARRRRRQPEKQRYILSERAKLGLTAKSIRSGEALQKYGTHSELTRRRQLVQRLIVPFGEPDREHRVYHRKHHRDQNARDDERDR